MAESFNHFGSIADALPKVLGQVVRKTAFDGLAHMQSFIRANGQIDTGYMINSGYVVTDTESTYSGGAKALPEIPRSDSPTTAYVAIAAFYAFWQNYGTRYIPGRPFAEPGIEATRASFEAACAAIEAKLAEAAR